MKYPKVLGYVPFAGNSGLQFPVRSLVEEPTVEKLTVDATRAFDTPPTEDSPLVGDLHQWMRAERARLSRHADVAKAMDYMLKRWVAFTRFIENVSATHSSARIQSGWIRKYLPTLRSTGHGAKRRSRMSASM